MWKFFFALLTVVAVAQTIACSDHPKNQNTANVYNSPSGGPNVFFSNIDDPKLGTNVEPTLDDNGAKIRRQESVQGIYQNGSND